MGAAAALASALLWATTSTILTALSARSSAVVLSGFRLSAAALFVPFVLLLTGGPGQIFAASPLLLTALIVSGVIGYGFGDTAYIRCLSLLGMPRTFPVSIAGYISLTVAGGAIFLDEPVSLALVAGAGLIALGITLVVLSSAEHPLEGIPVSGPAPTALAAFADLGPVVVLPRRRPKWATRAVEGYALLAGVSLAWAAATLLLAYAGEDLDAVGLWAIRTPVGAAGLVLWGVTTRRPAVLRMVADRKGMLIAIGAGAGTAVGSLCYVFSVVEIGAARAAVLSATSPLMALPLALIFLNERINVRVIAGTIACFAGIVLVAAS